MDLVRKPIDIEDERFNEDIALSVNDYMDEPIGLEITGRAENYDQTIYLSILETRRLAAALIKLADAVDATQKD